HPLHVESVAWVSERKDLLSTLFWMLTLWAYVRYAEEPGIGRFIVVFVALAMGLAAKPMLVTLPFVLLLLDYWPLQRLVSGEWLVVSAKNPQPSSTTPHSPLTAHQPRPASASWLVMEKLSLFALSAGSCVLTVYAQNRGRAVRALDDISFWDRAANAVLAYGAYLFKMVWPRDLAVLYPYRDISWSDGQVLATAA